MALKLGKCRLCLKLGDFYSIFTMDNATQLSEMVMECTKIKVYEGDGLPDKVCSECIQKLSSAYIFKQQCERADEELRRNYVPPPGFSISPPPPNRQSSDSAFSTHTDNSNIKSSSNDIKLIPATRGRKRSIESDNASIGSRTQEYSRPTGSKRVQELRRSQKRPRMSPNRSQDSDYDDYGADSSYIPETDESDDPVVKNEIQCTICFKTFKWKKSLTYHMTHVHKNSTLSNDALVNIPENNINNDTEGEKSSCEKCGKTFKLKIMLKRHLEVCGNSVETTPQKQLLISLEPIDAVQNTPTCEYCTAKFKTIDNLEKHLRVVHAAALKKNAASTESPNTKTSSVNNSQIIKPVPCIYCKKKFTDYRDHNAHCNVCPQIDFRKEFQCLLCDKVTANKSSYYSHIRSIHFMVSRKSDIAANEFECRMCNKKLPTQDKLISHLAAHMSNIEEDDDFESRQSPVDDTISIQSSHTSQGASLLKCGVCDKEFKYKKALESHEQKHAADGVEVKEEPTDNAQNSLLREALMRNSDSESSQEEGDDNTCDICEKQFSYKRLLIQHKKTKHNQCSGIKRAKINLKDCLVKCLICDVEMKVGAINEHNQKHISANIKPRNVYTCAQCEQKFKSCSNLANHIKLIHRLKQQQVPKKYVGQLSDFCEVVVKKAEPLDDVQSHNGSSEVPSSAAPLGDLHGFTCPICNKKMPTLISLKRHVNWHSNVGDTIEQKYECFVCKEKFRFRSHYKLHMREHYHDTNLDPQFLTCNICNRKSKHLRAAQAHMNYHKQTRFQAKDYQCSICKRVFQFRKVYLSHMAVHYKKGDSANNTIVGSTIPNSAKDAFDGAFTCQLCGKVSDSETSLKYHLIWHKSKTLLFGARYDCEICQLQFTNKRHLELHTRSHYEDENGPFKCTVCGKGFIDEDYCKRHLKGHNFDHTSHKKRIEKLRKGKVKCPICSRYYPDVGKLIRHLRRTHPESKMIKEDPDAPAPGYFSCKLCAKVFLDERRLKHHEESHLRKPCTIKCKFCGKKTMSLKSHRLHIKGHLTSKYTEAPLACPRCPQTFVLGYALHRHLRDAHAVLETWVAEPREPPRDAPLAPLQCALCLKQLASKGNFERHLDYHNSLRCNYCFEYFGSSRFLEGHLAFSCDKRKLIGDADPHPKRVKCDVCYKAFALRVKLDCHLRTMHGIKVSREASAAKVETVCDYCFKVFENEDALSTHKIYHRTVGFYGCIYCPRKFSTQAGYRKHKNHHFSQLNVDNPNKCEHCDETFVAFREMIYHMRDVHNDDKEWIVLPKDSVEETCHICNKSFFNLHKHLAYHEENKCKKCNEYFFSNADFDNHLCSVVSDDEEAIATGTSLQTYEDCTFCFKPITKKDSKKKHDMLHKTSGAISCRFCHHKFKTLDAFNIHAFTHRNRKYDKKPLKCRICKEKFVKYGPFIRHMRSAHRMFKKGHYRAQVKPERCVVCGGDFPNLHNHYRAHLLNQCQQCRKYFTSTRLFNRHQCDKEDIDPSKVFTSDENLRVLINTYVPKDLKDDEKFYGYTDDEEDAEVPVTVNGDRETGGKPDAQPIDSQLDSDERNLHMMVQSPIISDVLSLYQKGNDSDNQETKSQTSEVGEVVQLTDDDSVDVTDTMPVVVIVDDD